MPTATPSFALQSVQERRLILTEAAARLRLAPLIVEKDFWVGWLLGRLFAMPALTGQVQFKGGTSLSMVFGAVQRFSEDIDLAILPAAMGFEEGYFNDAPSASQRRKRMEALAQASEAYVQRLQPVLEADIASVLGASSSGESWLSYEIDSNAGTPNLWFTYPSVTPQTSAYIAKRVKLEFGSLTNQQPSVQAVARTMLSGVLPAGAFADLVAPVVALDVARTFWEKATILHAEYHRPEHLPVRDRFARHYSDFCALWQQDHARTAGLARLDLLADVALHKSRYFASSWANYDSAVLGTLKLVPPAYRWDAISEDYATMLPMFWTEPPPFATLMQRLAEAEAALNAQ
ncbi:MAG: nucleotidyl transferase AbiEii/AbiGii toxin family protein [Burkholderiales bacterium]|nr:nucleotidyl transferase AbiEii/AbiGii toxin family protein [Burkholderiales bacterium]